MKPTNRKILVWNALVLAVMIVASVIGRHLSRQGAIGPHWILYWIVATNLAIVVGNGVLSIGLKRRQWAAKADGHTLCSKCEYPLDLRDLGGGPAVCPECGCKRTESEHDAAMKDWRFWK